MQQVLADLDSASNRLTQLDKGLTERLSTYSDMGIILARLVRTQVRCAHTDVAFAIYRLNEAVNILKQEDKELCKP